MEFEVNGDMNLNVSPFQADINKLNVDVIVNSVNKTLIVRWGADRAIHEAARPGLVD